MKDIIQLIGDARAVYGRVEARLKESGSVVRDGRITGKADKVGPDGKVITSGYARLTGEALRVEGLSPAEKTACDIVNAANLIERLTGLSMASVAGWKAKAEAAEARVAELEAQLATMIPAPTVAEVVPVPVKGKGKVAA